MSQTIQVMTTTETREQAKALARHLLEQRVAACVQIIGPIESLYWWEDEIQESEEYLCIAKSTISLYEALEAAILAAHPYDVPEIIAVPGTRTGAGYAAWLAKELGREA